MTHEDRVLLYSNTLLSGQNQAQKKPKKSNKVHFGTARHINTVVIDDINYLLNIFFSPPFHLQEDIDWRNLSSSQFSYVEALCPDRKSFLIGSKTISSLNPTSLSSVHVLTLHASLTGVTRTIAGWSGSKKVYSTDYNLYK